MPLYEFVCERCGARFENILRFEERDTPERCRSCGQPAHRVISRFAVGGGDAGPGLPAPSTCSSGGG